jgi:hypothetical protein
MRIPPRLVVLLAACSPLSSNAMYWREAFEALPLGTITGNPQWSELMGEGVLAACSVSDANPFSPGHSLLVGAVPAIGATRKVAVSTGPAHAYNGLNDPVVRLSARIHRTNRAQYFSLNLGMDETAALTLGTTLAGNVHVNGVDTGVPWITGRYAEVVLWYDMLGGRAHLQYDDAVILPWTAMGAPMTQFNRVWVLRNRIGATDSGVIHVDDLAVETVLQGVHGWWRCEDTAGHLLREHTGHFAPGALVDPPAQTRRDGIWASVQSGNDAHPNAGSVSGFRAFDIPATAAMPASTDWTLELVFFNSYGMYDQDYFALRSTAPAAVSSIRIGSLLTGGIRAWLRDRDGAALTEVMATGLIPPTDQRWHHVALVKSGAQLSTFFDYSLYNSVTIGADGDGAYEFPLPAQVTLGHSFFYDQNLVDEARFTRSALGVNAFLRAARPHLEGLSIFTDPALAVEFHVTGSHGRRYRIDGMIDRINWMPLHEFQCDRLYDRIGVINLPLDAPSYIFRAVDLGPETP